MPRFAHTPSSTASHCSPATVADGSYYGNDYCFVFELRDGLVHRAREYVDTARGHRLVLAEAPQAARPVLYLRRRSVRS
ncbi:hypothetical protein [Allokutzneria oryzae]|uniref:SnoaL-like domain-containing protein n=1 Tax=Allokutzneria oryzae TaxID=1378989 RepID=A0ABV5ZTI6_9PSEU